MSREQELVREMEIRIDDMANRHAVFCADLMYRDMRFRAAVDAGRSGNSEPEEGALTDAVLETGEGASTDCLSGTGEGVLADCAPDAGVPAGAAFVQKEREIHAFLSGFLGVTDRSREDMMRQVRREAMPVTKLLEILKEALKAEIKNRPVGLRHVTDQKDLKIIRASEKRMNMYRNACFTAVFATSDESQTLLYAARAAGGSMIVDSVRGVCCFDTEPFADHAGDIYTLKKTAYAYELDPELFEPVIDFLLKKDGHVRICYGSEWICGRGSVPVRGCQEITQIDIRKLGGSMRIDGKG